MSEVLARGHFVFRDARSEDDPILRGILRATPLPGWVTLNYEREPNYFQGCAIEGNTRTVLASTPDGAPVSAIWASYVSCHSGAVAPAPSCAALRSVENCWTTATRKPPII